MPGSPPPAGPFVYQLRVVLRGVSPLIWRRLLVRSDTSIADLHTTLQLGWSDEHLNRLVIHGRDYGVAARVVSGSGTTRMRSSLPISACASANGSSTSTTSSTAGATTYGWKRSCRSGGVGAPVCTGGRRSAPPEGCGGPWVFPEQRQSSPLRLIELLAALLEADPDQRGGVLGGRCGELEELCGWLRLDRFDRRAANRRLAAGDGRSGEEPGMRIRVQVVIEEDEDVPPGGARRGGPAARRP